MTTVNYLDEAVVLYVADDRKESTLTAFYEELGEEACEGLEAVAMDMWAPYIRATRKHVPEADRRIVYDKFHVAWHLGEAVDRVRSRENRELRAQGDDRLVRTRFLWLQNPERMSRRRWRDFGRLRDSQLKVARAWALKETAMALWGYQQRGWAERMWRRWYGWAMRSRLEPMKRVARMIKSHWEGVINAATSDITNALSEGMNAKIQWIKRKACGYRNRERFRQAIYFHLGGLDLYPESLRSAHSKA